MTAGKQHTKASQTVFPKTGARRGEIAGRLWDERALGVITLILSREAGASAMVAFPHAVSKAAVRPDRPRTEKINAGLRNHRLTRRADAQRKKAEVCSRAATDVSCNRKLSQGNSRKKRRQAAALQRRNFGRGDCSRWARSEFLTSRAIRLARQAVCDATAWVCCCASDRRTSRPDRHR